MNGSLYLHIYLTRSGFPPGPRKDLYVAELYTIHRTKRVTFLMKPNENASSNDTINSCLPSNWTVNLVDSSAICSWLKGPERRLIDCDPLTNKLYPILYLNDKL